MLREDTKKNFQRIIESSKDPQSAILALLHEIQKENGYICEEDACELSELTKIPYSKIKSVMTFYTMYNLRKTGKYHIQLCRNLPCHIAKAAALKEIIEKTLNIKEGEITQDGLFSFSQVECLGSCGTAPVIMVNETYHESMDEDKLKKLIEDLRGSSNK